MYKYLLMNENNGAGNDLPGDRGDNLESAADIAAREAKAAEDKAAADAKAADEAAAAEKLVADAKAADEEKAAAAAARDPATGKFAKKDKEVPDHVPKARMDEAVNKERAGREAAERRAAELEAQVKKEERTDAVKVAEDAIEVMEKEHSRLLLDGEDAKASAKMKEIRLAERRIASMENDTKLQAATTQAVEQVRMDATIARLAADHPQLRDGSEEFDEDLVNFVLSEQSRLMQTERLAPSAALAKAAENVMKKFQPAAAADPEGKKSLTDAKDVADRKAEQVKKNLDTAAKQPASMRETGMDTDKAGQTEALPDINKLTSEEIAALPKTTLARMRGDFL
jgi:hypothetical protein